MLRAQRRHLRFKRDTQSEKNRLLGHKKKKKDTQGIKRGTQGTKKRALRAQNKMLRAQERSAQGKKENMDLKYGIKCFIKAKKNQCQNI